jgi:hypothetical protein
MLVCDYFLPRYQIAYHFSCMVIGRLAVNVKHFEHFLKLDFNFCGHGWFVRFLFGYMDILICTSSYLLIPRVCHIIRDKVLRKER